MSHNNFDDTGKKKAEMTYCAASNNTFFFFLQDSAVFILRGRICVVNLPFVLFRYSNPASDAGNAFFEKKIQGMWRWIPRARTVLNMGANVLFTMC